MKVLTLNCGSSSVKYALFYMPDKTRLCLGIVDRVTSGGSLIKHHGIESQEYTRSGWERGVESARQAHVSGYWSSQPMRSW